MSLAPANERLDVRAEFSKLQQAYADNATSNTFNLLLIGKPGTGKTTCIGTAPAPILVHSFDPGGLKSIRHLIAAGKVLPNAEFELEDDKAPTAITKWEAEFLRLKRIGLFEHVGTYVIDSCTTFIRAMMNEVLRRNSRAGSLPEIKHYGEVVNMVNIAIKQCLALPCNFILTGHIDSERDETSGRMENNLSVYPSLRKMLPLLFDERYVMINSATSQGTAYSLQTQGDAQYTASSRFSNTGQLKRHEPADLKAILKKIGFPAEDKPLFTE